jgi:hypothetical protein
LDLLATWFLWTGDINQTGRIATRRVHHPTKQQLDVFNILLSKIEVLADSGV